MEWVLHEIASKRNEFPKAVNVIESVAMRNGYVYTVQCGDNLLEMEEDKMNFLLNYCPELITKMKDFKIKHDDELGGIMIFRKEEHLSIFDLDMDTKMILQYYFCCGKDDFFIEFEFDMKIMFDFICKVFENGMSFVNYQ